MNELEIRTRCLRVALAQSHKNTQDIPDLFEDLLGYVGDDEARLVALELAPAFRQTAVLLQCARDYVTLLKPPKAAPAPKPVRKATGGKKK